MKRQMRITVQYDDDDKNVKSYVDTLRSKTHNKLKGDSNILEFWYHVEDDRMEAVQHVQGG